MGLGHTSLILGESHTGKTRSLSTLPGRSVLFNFDSPDNASSLRVPFKEVLRLVEWWKRGEAIDRVVVVQYNLMPQELGLRSAPDVSAKPIQALIEDVNSIREHLGEVENLILETLGPFADEVLDFVVADNNRKQTEIQDYKTAKKKLFSILGSMMATGKNVVVTGHLQSDKDEVTGRGRVVPLIWGSQLPDLIPKFFGEVFQSVSQPGKRPGEVEYKWVTKPTQWLGFLGTRKFDNLPAVIEQDYGYLEKLSQGGK